jgi:dynein regulatry complex protein 1
MRLKITAETTRRRSARSVPTKFKTKSLPLTKRTSKLTGTGKNSKRKKTARSCLRYLLFKYLIPL